MYEVEEMTALRFSTSRSCNSSSFNLMCSLCTGSRGGATFLQTRNPTSLCLRKKTRLGRGRAFVFTDIVIRHHRGEQQQHHQFLHQTTTLEERARAADLAANFPSSLVRIWHHLLSTLAAVLRRRRGTKRKAKRRADHEENY
ncbi:unnamed protein product [Amoebophrya sp. A25]|nr:unnamed protein product [Amoebophrya sp. A25]|eukprot:GSA25T00008100001.1